MEFQIDNSMMRESGEWNAIWSLDAHHKIIIFLQRLARDCLPTRERLITKSVQCTTICPMCDRLIESSWPFFRMPIC